MSVNLRRVIGIELMFGFVLLVAGGCGSKVLPNSGNHPPLKPSDVKIYQKQPKEYEELGTITVKASQEMHWDQRGDSTKGFQAMIDQAAAMGANGVLLIDPDAKKKPKDIDPNADYGNAQVTAGYKGMFYQVPLRPGIPPTAVGQAIYVVKE